MKKRFIRKSLLALLMFLPMFLGLGATIARAESKGLTISPPIIEPDIKPGERAEFTIRVNNPTESLIEDNIYVLDFRAKGDAGEPDFYTATDDNAKYSISKWVTYNQSKIALTPGQVVEFKFTISVPANAEPGGHYGAVFFADTPPKLEGDSSQVALSSMIGTLILAKVPGDVTESALVQDFSTDRLLYLRNQVSFDLRVTNAGNVHVKPVGDILIRNIFGSIVDQVKVNEQGGNVLPGSTRKFSTSWKSKKILFGYYTAEAKMIYGDSKALSAKTGLWIIPLWSIILVIGLILALVVWLIYRGRKGRKGNGSGATRNAPPTQPQPPISPKPMPPSGGVILR